MPDGLSLLRVTPLPNDMVSLGDSAGEFTRWHFGKQSPRLFFHPFNGPRGESLTRMGHPGDPSHDHHRSIWFGHEKVSGVDFWSNPGPGRIEQTQWLAYASGDEEATMAVRLTWHDGHDPAPLMTQDLVAAYIPSADAADRLLELHSTFLPTAETLEFGQTNFGILGVRVAESISAVFGGGKLTGSDGNSGEKALFGLPNRWMDYSGPIAQTDDGPAWEGITFYDHPSNPNHPAKWHIRDDGWMGPSLCRDAAVLTTRSKPLVLRYLLHAHAGPVDPARNERIFQEFSGRPGFIVERAKRPHRRFEILRG